MLARTAQITTLMVLLLLPQLQLRGQTPPISDPLYLGDNDPAVRVARVRLLEAHPSSEIAALLRLAAKDRSPLVRRAAARVMALKQIMAQRLHALARDDADRFVRVTAIRGLGAFDAVRTGPLLIPFLAHSRSEIRVAAVDALGRCRYSAALPRLLGLLADSNLTVRLAAISAVAHWPTPKVVGRLEELLMDPLLMVRKRAIRTLGRLKVRHAMPLLLQRLGSLDVEELRIVLRALGQIADRRATPALLKLIWQKNQLIAVDAISALGRIGDTRAIAPLFRYLQSGQDGSFFALTALKRIGDPCVPPAIRLLSRTHNRRLARQLLELLVHLRAKRAVPVLQTLLERRDPVIRIASLRALRYLADARIVEQLIAVAQRAQGRELLAALRALNVHADQRALTVLIRHMAAPSQKARVVVARGLGAIKSLRAVRALLAALVTPDLTVKKAVLLALRKQGSTLANPQLLALLGDADSEIRYLAGEALAASRDTRLLSALLKLAKQPYYLGKYQALRTLGQLLAHDKPSGVLAEVERLVRAADPRLAYLALAALGSAGSRRSTALVVSMLADRRLAFRRKALGVLSQLPGLSGRAERVRKLLRSADYQQRSRAAWALGAIRDRAAATSLRRLLQRDPRWEVRANAAWALGRLSDQVSRVALQNCLLAEEPYLAANCAWALGVMGDRAAVESLRALFKRLTSPPLRLAVAVAILRVDRSANAPSQRLALQRELRLPLPPKNDVGLRPIVSIDLRDAKGQPIVHEVVALHFPDGAIKIDFTDADGIAIQTKVAGRGMRWTFPRLRF